MHCSVPPQPEKSRSTRALPLEPGIEELPHLPPELRFRPGEEMVGAGNLHLARAADCAQRRGALRGAVEHAGTVFLAVYIEHRRPEFFRQRDLARYADRDPRIDGRMARAVEVVLSHGRAHAMRDDGDFLQSLTAEPGDRGAQALG